MGQEQVPRTEGLQRSQDASLRTISITGKRRELGGGLEGKQRGQAGAGWGWLGQAGTGWNRLEQAGAGWNRLGQSRAGWGRLRGWGAPGRKAVDPRRGNR